MSQHILIAEDCLELLDILVEILKLRASNISTAHTGMDAIHKIGKSIPDILVIDVNMPYVSGLEVLTYLRSIPGGDHTRVILMTGDSYIKRAQGASLADKILMKPFDIEELLNEIM